MFVCVSEREDLRARECFAVWFLRITRGCIAMYICVRTRLLVCVSVLAIAVYTGIFVEGECTCVVGVCLCVWKRVCNTECGREVGAICVGVFV